MYLDKSREMNKITQELNPLKKNISLIIAIPTLNSGKTLHITMNSI